MIEMKAEQQRYKIRYMECEEKTHQGEKLNLVCLHSDCRDKPLICSLCRQGKHKEHNTSPFKFYIEDLKQKFTASVSDYAASLQQLQKSRILFLLKMQTTVQKIAEQFRQLEQDVLDRFQHIRSQILQNQSLRNQFTDFYYNLTHCSEKQPQFFMAQYLPKKQTSVATNLDLFDKFTATSINEIIALKNQILSGQSTLTKPNILVNPKLYITPENIKVNGNIFSQSNHVLTSPSLCLIDQPFSKLDGKIFMRVQMLRKGGKIILGLMTKQFFNGRKFFWNFQKTPELMWFGNQGTGHNTEKLNLKAIYQGTKIQMERQNSSLIISNKKNQTVFTPKKQQQFYVFFVLQGKTELEITYHPKK